MNRLPPSRCEEETRPGGAPQEPRRGDTAILCLKFCVLVLMLYLMLLYSLSTGVRRIDVLCFFFPFLSMKEIILVIACEFQTMGKVKKQKQAIKAVVWAGFLVMGQHSVERVEKMPTQDLRAWVQGQGDAPRP